MLNGKIGKQLREQKGMYNSLRSTLLQASGLNANSYRIKLTWIKDSGSVSCVFPPVWSHLCLWRWFYPVSIPLSTASPAPSSFSECVLYHAHFASLMASNSVSEPALLFNTHDWGIIKSAILVLQSLFKKVTENVIHFSKFFIKNIELIFWISWPWSCILIILRVVLPGRTQFCQINEVSFC